MIKEVKDWFDGLYESPKTAAVDKRILENAKRMWANRRGPHRELSLTEALQNKEQISGRNIWVLNYDGEGRSQEGQKTHDELPSEWKAKRSIRPRPLVRTSNSR
jgi:hypothetical protein